MGLLSKLLIAATLLASVAAAGTAREPGYRLLVFGASYQLPGHCTLLVEPSLDQQRLTFLCDAAGAVQSDVLVFQPVAACGPQALVEAAEQAGLRAPQAELLLDTETARLRHQTARMQGELPGQVAHIQIAADERVCAVSFSDDARRGRRLLDWALKS